MIRLDIPRRDDESNWQWCQRYAAAIPESELVKALIARLRDVTGHSVRQVIGDATAHGSGISMAISERYGFED